ncbi:MAG: PAS domain-containing protein [Oceanisphaera sp.]|uniref:PAS domain-containing protein n=1 Tax=Oceanisphaera sp. TaxID=1929979 RepID=UPI003F9A0AD3
MHSDIATTVGRRINWPKDQLIVTKTDLTGKITYANRTFMLVSDYAEPQLIGQQHNIIRHPDMPRGIFKLLWKTLKENKEFFGFVKNGTANGDYYWVYANITPSFGLDGNKNGFFSVRRYMPSSAIDVIEPLYQQLKRHESGQDRRTDTHTSYQALMDYLENKEQSYTHWVTDLYRHSLDAKNVK